ncbi:hypothetical protein ACHQM5_008810 [Ranunculus cassubicifolius]
MGDSSIYNVEASEMLAKRASVLPISEAVPIYEQLVSTFPTSAKFWIQYVEASMAANNIDATKKIFGRCLLNCPQVPLWIRYISFIKKANEKRGGEGLEETRKAFEFMLNYVGNDIQSGALWIEYISFLRSLPMDELQRSVLMRKAYQEAVVLPTHQIEQIWKNYRDFENAVGKKVATEMISQFQPKHNSAKAVYRLRKSHADDIDWNMLAVPPTGSDKEEKQYKAWKLLIAFEKENPQNIDAVSVNKRITLSYEQCLMHLYHYPDIWYDYATWQAKTGSVEAAIKVYQRGLKAVPNSDVLRYAYAEFEESRGEIQSAKKIYESVLGNGSLEQIQLLRFIRRNEGSEAARSHFLSIYKSPNCSYQVYAAYAMIVFCLDKDSKNARKVFEEGMKKFMNEPKYILEYLDFLCRLNDDVNARALFERALSSLPPENSEEVWNRYIKFEQMYGDLSSNLKIEKRRKEAFSKRDEEKTVLSESSMYDFVSRYSFMDLCPCSSKDLDFLARQDSLVKSISTQKAERPTLPDAVIIPANLPNVDILKSIPGNLVHFITQLPAIKGQPPNVDTVLSMLLHSNIPIGQTSGSSSDNSNSSNSGKRKYSEWNEGQTSTAQNRVAPTDAFQLRQIQKARRLNTSQSGSAGSGGSTISGEKSGSM